MATLFGKLIRKGAKALSIMPGPLGLAGRAVSAITTIKDAKKAGATQAQAFQIATTKDSNIQAIQGNAGGSNTATPFDTADFLGIGTKKKVEEAKKQEQKKYLLYGGGALALITILLLLFRQPKPQNKNRY